MTARHAWGRRLAATTAAVITGLSVLAGLGVLSNGGSPSYAVVGKGVGVVAAADRPVPPRSDCSAQRRDPYGSVAYGGVNEQDPPRTGARQGTELDPVLTRAAELGALPPRDSGIGRRVVFDISDQRVWLVGADDAVRRTYLVSGSIYDNLDPGTYQVYSTSRTATAFDDSGSMRWMVRFARGDRAAIGFHNIPEADGVPQQTQAQLGTPLSHGCIRQAEADAKALWRFAPVGSTVVVTA